MPKKKEGKNPYYMRSERIREVYAERVEDEFTKGMKTSAIILLKKINPVTNQSIRDVFFTRDEWGELWMFTAEEEIFYLKDHIEFTTKNLEASLKDLTAKVEEICSDVERLHFLKSKEVKDK